MLLDSTRDALVALGYRERAKREGHEKRLGRNPHFTALPSASSVVDHKWNNRRIKCSSFQYG